MPNIKKDKQVRFAYNLHTFHPSTPAPNLSPSNSAPNTPPPSQKQCLPRISPYNSTYFSPSMPRPHPFLEPSAVSWNLMDHVSSITRNNHPSTRAFYEPATTPPMPFLTITSRHLPWIIDVYASNGSFVTLGDVLNSIYCSLRTNITTYEFNSFPQQRDQVRATRAYEQRYRRFRNAYNNDEEKRAGMKRIDFLMSHTKFHGISNNGLHPDQWQLNVLPLGV